MNISIVLSRLQRDHEENIIDPFTIYVINKIKNSKSFPIYIKYPNLGFNNFNNLSEAASECNYKVEIIQDYICSYIYISKK